MERIIKILGNAVIEKVEKVNDIFNWSRRSGFLGFEGYLVIKLTEDGRTYACIDNNARCISTSCGELSLTKEGAVFTTANSIYTFRLMNGALTRTA